jgi:hypothetical protein
MSRNAQEAKFGREQRLKARLVSCEQQKGSSGSRYLAYLSRFLPDSRSSSSFRNTSAQTPLLGPLSRRAVLRPIPEELSLLDSCC